MVGRCWSTPNSMRFWSRPPAVLCATRPCALFGAIAVVLRYLVGYTLCTVVFIEPLLLCQALTKHSRQGPLNDGDVSDVIGEAVSVSPPFICLIHSLIVKAYSSSFALSSILLFYTQCYSSARSSRLKIRIIVVTGVIALLTLLLLTSLLWVGGSGGQVQNECKERV